MKKRIIFSVFLFTALLFSGCSLKRELVSGISKGAPIYSVNFPAEADYSVLVPPFVLSGTCSTGLKTVLFSCGSAGKYAALSGSNWQVSYDYPEIGNGGLTLQVYARLDDGTLVFTTNLTVLVSNDTLPPDLELLSPEPGSTSALANCVFSGIAADPGPLTSGTSGVFLSIDNGLYCKASGTNTWTAVFSNLQNGPHSVSAYALDRNGNRTSNCTWVFSVNKALQDVTPPGAHIDLPQNGTIIGTYSYPVSGTALDSGNPVTGIRNVYLSVNGSQFKVVGGAEVWQTNLSGLSEGSYSLRVYAVDNAGNTGPTDSTVSFRVSNDNWGFYYAPAYGRNGADLEKALHQIIRPHIVLPYTSGQVNDVWAALKDCDEDPSNTNNILCVYTRASISKSSNEGWLSVGTDHAWNREHLWAKSHGFQDPGPAPYTDVHHLRASDGNINSARNNKDFDAGDSIVYNYGIPTLCRSTANSWEPPDEMKGDIARTLFYMAVCYDGGSDPDLQLVDYVNTDPNNQKLPLFGKLSTLIQWSLQDPPGDAERLRNNKVYSNWQHNRNPFVDHPEWVTNIWH